MLGSEGRRGRNGFATAAMPRGKAHEGKDMQKERVQLTSNPRREGILRAEPGLRESIGPGKAMRIHARS